MTTADIRRLAAADAEDYRALMLHGFTHEPDAFTSTAAERSALPLTWWLSRIGAAPDSPEVVLGIVGQIPAEGQWHPRLPIQ